jgi:hypothetical protein
MAGYSIGCLLSRARAPSKKRRSGGRAKDLWWWNGWRLM